MNKLDAVSILERQISEIRKVKATADFSPTFSKWHRDTRVALTKIFSGDKKPAEEFDNISFSLPICTSSTPDSAFAKAYQDGLEQAEAFIDSCISEVKDYCLAGC